MSFRLNLPEEYLLWSSTHCFNGLGYGTPTPSLTHGLRMLIWPTIGDADGFSSLLMNKIVDHKSSDCLCHQVTDQEDHTQVWNCMTRYEVINNAEELDWKNGNTFWMDSLAKEMAIAFKLLEPGQKAPPGWWTKTTGHVIFDVKWISRGRLDGWRMATNSWLNHIKLLCWCCVLRDY